MKKTVTVGIPAFNEAQNIKNIILDVLGQIQDGFIIKNIIVFSDGSDDETVSIVKSLKLEHLILIDNKERKGLAHGINAIAARADADTLVVLNADIRIHDTYFIREIIKPIINGADLTSVRMVPLEERSFIERVLNTSTKLKTWIYEHYNDGKNVYTCFGTARAFSKNLYKSIKLEYSVGEDAFSYLYSKTHNFLYAYVNTTHAFYRNPNTFNDHKKQSLRFFQSQQKLEKTFGRKTVKECYTIPFYLYIEAFFIFFIKSPLSLLLYIVIFTFLRIKSFYIFASENDLWEIAVSSKSI